MREISVNRETRLFVKQFPLLIFFYLLCYHFYMKFESHENVSWQKVQSH